ncbi:H-NS histone family protein [Dechloromonas sp. ZS-1]|uniref:H-NS histone family protein n=1 Tax=Dechloromonas sp. ZS-1 TaxID=3138067 RepID=UPI0031FC9206
MKRREKQEKVTIRQELAAIAAAKGYSLDDLFGTEPKRELKVTKQVAVKYRSPADSSLTWTGRGRQPKWVVEFFAQGGCLDQLAV